MPERSKELIQVGYYLSKYGQNTPPDKLETDKWNEAYRMFYDSLNGGRNVLEFEHSLKNARDAFDSYFPDTNREGWKIETTGEPAPLTGHSQEVFDEFKNKSENEVHADIFEYINSNKKVSVNIFNDMIAEDISNMSDYSSRTEGGVKVKISKTTERNSALRQIAIDIHGLNCQVCGFNYEEVYGNWGKDYIEVHHLIPVSEYKKRQETDPKLDLVVLCANCHRMVHRKKNTTLTLQELQSKM